MFEDIFDVVLDPEFEDVDITDKTILQEQFNYARHTQMKLIGEYEEIQKKISDLEYKISSIKRDYYSDPEVNKRDISSLLNANEEYITKECEKKAYERAEKIIAEKLYFTKQDIKILQNSMYTRF